MIEMRTRKKKLTVLITIAFTLGQVNFAGILIPRAYAFDPTSGDITEPPMPTTAVTEDMPSPPEGPSAPTYPTTSPSPISSPSLEPLSTAYVPPPDYGIIFEMCRQSSPFLVTCSVAAKKNKTSGVTVEKGFIAVTETHDKDTLVINALGGTKTESKETAIPGFHHLNEKYYVLSLTGEKRLSEHNLLESKHSIPDGEQELKEDVTIQYLDDGTRRVAGYNEKTSRTDTTKKSSQPGDIKTYVERTEWENSRAMSDWAKHTVSHSTLTLGKNSKGEIVQSSDGVDLKREQKNYDEFGIPTTHQIETLMSVTSYDLNTGKMKLVDWKEEVKNWRYSMGFWSSESEETRKSYTRYKPGSETEFYENNVESAIERNGVQVFSFRRSTKYNNYGPTSLFAEERKNGVVTMSLELKWRSGYSAHPPPGPYSILTAASIDGTPLPVPLSRDAWKDILRMIVLLRAAESVCLPPPPEAAYPGLSNLMPPQVT